MAWMKERSVADHSNSTDPVTAENPRRRSGANWRALLSFRNISALYLFVVLMVTFSILTPRTFLAPGTWVGLLDAEALTILAAIAVMIPLTAGLFNLAIGAEIAWAVMLVAVLQARLGLPFELAIVLTIACGAFIGWLSGTIITKFRIDSFIATLGMGSILLALKWLISDNRPTVGLDEGFREVARAGIVLVRNSDGRPLFQLTVPVLAMLVIALIVWFFLERTPLGRKVYAVGYNAEGARLSGVHVTRMQVGSLMAGGAIAATAGVLLASKLNSGDPTVGVSMLLPALTAAFLGSTQFRGGRFNVWGTVVALCVLAVGIKGLQLLGTAGWVEGIFYGVALIAAVALSRWERKGSRFSALRRLIPLRSADRGPAAP
jgi:ribose transport system permease protein